MTAKRRNRTAKPRTTPATRGRVVRPARRSAALLTALDRAAHGDEEHVRKLLHELQVHSEEITVQNEQLLKAQAELEHARDRYADLYDFAPIGYLQIDARAAIADINLAGAALLGRPRSFIINLPLATMFTPDQLDPLRNFLIASRLRADDVVQIESRVRRHPDRIVRLVSRPLGIGAGLSRLLIAMLDVSEERRFEAERHAAYEREQRRAAELAKEVKFRIKAEERVKALLERLVQVQEEERRRLALNLHDHLGQQLTALRLTIGALREDHLTVDETRRRLELMETIVSQMDRDVDFLAWELRPAALDDMGLDAALTEFVRQWSAAQGVAAEFHDALPDDGRLSADIESHLYRIVQEALNNVSKHAGAEHVSVLLERRGDDVTLIVEDNGRGFDIGEIRRNGKHGGMGLEGMHERVASIGGQMQYESTPGKGTAIFVRIPVRTS